VTKRIDHQAAREAYLAYKADTSRRIVEARPDLADREPGPIMKDLQLKPGDAVCLEQNDFVALAHVVHENAFHMVVTDCCWVQHKGSSDRDFHTKGVWDSNVKLEPRGSTYYVFPLANSRVSPWRTEDPTLMKNFTLPVI